MDNEYTTESRNDAEPNALAQCFEHATAVLTAALPTPLPNTAEAQAARDLNAITQVAALVPVNAAEVMFAVQIVAANAQGLDSQRQAQGLDPIDAKLPLQQTATMMRVAQGGARVLLGLQSARQKREATPDSANSAMLTQHCTLQLMRQALTKQAAAAQQAALQRAAAEAEAEAARASPPPPEPDPPTEADIAAAEAYAQSNPTNTNRARILRRKRGMPDWGMFTPPEDAVINALVHGHSPILDALLPGPSGS